MTAGIPANAKLAVSDVVLKALERFRFGVSDDALRGSGTSPGVAQIGLLHTDHTHRR